MAADTRLRLIAIETDLGYLSLASTEVGYASRARNYVWVIGGNVLLGIG
jgi:hypothetical protein